jgi:hypothetical protein
MIETEAVEQITNGLRSLVWTVAIVSGLAGACLGAVCSLAILWAVRLRGHDARPDTTAKRSSIDGLHAAGAGRDSDSARPRSRSNGTADSAGSCPACPESCGSSAGAVPARTAA